MLCAEFWLKLALWFANTEVENVKKFTDGHPDKRRSEKLNQVFSSGEPKNKLVLVVNYKKKKSYWYPGCDLKPIHTYLKWKVL